MGNRIVIEAFAKINIGLGIGTLDDEGYHPISSIFHAVGLSDSISIEMTETPGIEVLGSFDCPIESSTVYRAAASVIEYFNIQKGCRISVTKRIPVKAGLGGGSADAAGVLEGLVRLFSIPADSSELEKMGAAIGSDVPFFLKGGAAYVSGRGELVERIAARNDFFILLAYPGFGVSTAEAFAGLDDYRRKSGVLNPGSLATKKELLDMFTSKPENWHFKNHFKEYLENEHPLLMKIDSLMKSTGALYTSPTGSGSCIYGIYDSSNSAKKAKHSFYSSATGFLEEKTLESIVLYVIKPLETSIVIR